MMNAVKRFSVVRSCRVGLSFGTGDSNLLVCGLLYIPGRLFFFPSEKSPRAVFSCGAMKPSFPPPGPPGAVTGQCPSQAVCPAGRDRNNTSSAGQFPVVVSDPVPTTGFAAMLRTPPCWHGASTEMCVADAGRGMSAVFEESGQKVVPSSPGNGRLSVWRPDSKKLRLFPLFCQASGESVRNSTGFSKTGLSDGKM